MKKTLNITLAVEVESDLDSVSEIVDDLSFAIESEGEVKVKDHFVVDYFEVF